MQITFQLPTMTKIAVFLVNHAIKYLQDLSHDLLTTPILVGKFQMDGI